MELDDPKKKLRTELRNESGRPQEKKLRTELRYGTGRPEEKIKNCDGAGLEFPPLWFWTEDLQITKKRWLFH